MQEQEQQQEHEPVVFVKQPFIKINGRKVMLSEAGRQWADVARRTAGWTAAGGGYDPYYPYRGAGKRF